MVEITKINLTILITKENALSSVPSLNDVVWITKHFSELIVVSRDLKNKHGVTKIKHFSELSVVSRDLRDFDFLQTLEKYRINSKVFRVFIKFI